MSTLQQRFALLRERRPDISQADLKRATGASAPSVSAWFKGGTKEMKMGTAMKAAALYGVNAQWLSTGEGPMEADQGLADAGVRALHPEDGVPDDSVQVPEYKIKLSGGNGSTAIEYELTEESEPATYRLSWLQRNQLKLSNLKRFKVTGDSMEPLLFHGDSVLVNMAENSIDHIIDGKVYAIRYGDELRVKRLFRRLDGALTLKSYNQDFKDEDVPPDLVSRNITIIGRVRDKSGGGGL